MPMPKSLAVSALALALASLSACQPKDAPAPQDSASTTSDAGTQMAGMAEAMGPDAKPGTSANSGRLVLPVVAGRPAGVYFTFTNTRDKPVELAAVHIDGVKTAQMHKTEGGKMLSLDSLKVPAGATVTFKPGALHVMAFDLDDSLKSGGTTEMTLTFADGDKLSLPLTIETMGAGMSGGMGDMSNMGDMGHGSMNHEGMAH